MVPRWNKIRHDIINRHPTGYVVAVSGGVDSMFLLDFVSKLPVPLTIAYFDHKVRDSGDNDRALIKSVCDKHNLQFVHGAANTTKYDNGSLEHECRKQRYSFLRAIMQEYNHARLMTAHHLNDQAETILINLFVRSRPFDQLGMLCDNGLMYRPLLSIPKDTIVKQSIKRGIQWLDDVTNTDTAYERNWIRHEVLPIIGERRNPLKMAERFNMNDPTAIK